MRFGKFLLMLSVGFLLTVSSYAYEYHDVTTKVTRFDYSNYTFTYMEDGVEKTANLTDEALTPAHQIALLREVYTNPDIPGIKYAYDYNGRQSRKLDYNQYGHLGQEDACYWLGTSSDTYPNPNEDGMTMLLVQLNNTWETKNHSKMKTAEQYFSNAIKSIKLMTDFVRVNDSEDPGYLFSVDAVVNRFFFISKGKARSTFTKPLYRLFEQISPIDVYSETETGSLIDVLRSGNIYYCFHDCSGVCSYQPTGESPHWFTVSSDGETYDIKNLTIFMSDRRFEDELAPASMSDVTNNSSYYNEYGNGQNPGEEDWFIMPRVFLYEVSLEVSSSVCEDNEDYVNVRLDWSTVMPEINAPEHFWVYQVNGQELELLTTIDTQPTMARTHEFLVERQIDVQEMSFVVVAAPIVYDNDWQMYRDAEGNPLKTISAKSNTVKVVIPGKDPYFSQAASVRSRYEIDKDINVYKNVLTVSPTSRSDYESIKNNTSEFSLTRDDNQGNKVTVATIRYTQKADLSGYNYTITYNEASQDLVNLFDDEVPVTSGSFSAYDESYVYIIDRFSASTATNSHPAKYTYRLEQTGGDYSNSVDVKVYKTTNNISPYGVTQEDVAADTDRSLNATPMTTITFDAINDPYANLLEYGIYAIDGNNTIKKVSKAENAMNDGVYVIYGTKNTGALDAVTGNVAIGPQGGQITTIDYNKSATTTPTYVPVIKTSYSVLQSEYNTYGCEKKSLSYPSVKANIKKRNNKDQLYITDIYEGPEGFYRTYVAEVEIKPNLKPAPGYMVYRYRVWRVNGDKNNNYYTYYDLETLLDDVEDVSGTSIDENGNPVDWASNYTEIQNFYPSQGNITFTDLYSDKAIITDTDRKTVPYIIRMYATPLPSAGAPAYGAAPKNAEGHDYLISEVTVKAVYYTTTVITKLDEIKADSEAEVKSVTYYNVLGAASDKPFSGVNIVATRYTDGTVKAEKRLFPER